MKDDVITLINYNIVEGSLGYRFNVDLNEAFTFSVTAGSGEEIYYDRFLDPLISYYDYVDVPGRMGGGMIVADSADFIVRLPYMGGMETIHFYKNNRDGTRGNCVGILSLKDVKPGRGCVLPVNDDIIQNATIQHVAGDSTKKLLNFILLAEGYTQAELSSGKFLQDFKRCADKVFKGPPYKDYQNRWNLWAINVASARSGFGGYFGSFQSGRSIMMSGQAKALSLVQQLKPDYDLACVLVNVNIYGGQGYPGVCIASASELGGDLVAHESGHGYGGLGDEYDYPKRFELRYTPLREPINSTTETNRDRIKWRYFIQPGTPLPTPEMMQYDKMVGAFEGSNYQKTGWYRPKFQCCMNWLENSFCEVCCQLFLTKFYRKIKTIKGTIPSSKKIDYNAVPDKKLIVDIYQTTSNTILVTWTVNGSPVTGTSNVLDLTKVTLKNGDNSINAAVVDTTPYVKAPDLLGMLKESTEWTVTYSGSNGNAVSFEEPQHVAASLRAHMTGNRLSITYTSTRERHITMELHGINGRTIQQYYSGMALPGNRTLSFAVSPSMPSGVYFLAFTVDNCSYTKKLEYVK